MIFNTSSAANKIRNIHEELQKLVGQVSIQNSAGYLIEPAKTLWSELSEGQLKVDVLCVRDQHEPESLRQILEFLGGEELAQLKSEGKLVYQHNGVIYRIFDEYHFPVKKVDELPVLVKLCVVEAGDYDLEDLTYYTERLVKETALTAFYSQDSQVLNALRKVATGKTWKLMKIKDAAHWTELSEKLIPTAEVLNLLALIVSFSKMNVALESTIENEYKDLSARKIAVQNDHMKLKKMSTTRVGQEMFSSIKTNLQRSYSSFESGINERFNSLTKNQPGSLYSFLMDQIDGFNAMDTVASGTDTKFVLPDTDLDDLKNEIENGITEHLSHDVKSLNDFLQMTIDEINEQFKEVELAQFEYHHRDFSSTEIDRLLESQMGFEREHEPKTMKKGIMAYFSAIRQPYMIIIMMTSVLAPFIGNIRDKKWFPPVIAIALITGLYFAIKDAKKSKEETLQEELKKVRQWLKGEYKRIFSNLEREWKTRYFQHAKDEFQEIQRMAEEKLRNYQADRGQKISQETNLTQRKMQTLEAFDKKLNEAKRAKGQVESQLRTVRTELKQMFLKTEL